MSIAEGKRVSLLSSATSLRRLASWTLRFGRSPRFSNWSEQLRLSRRAVRHSLDFAAGYIHPYIKHCWFNLKRMIKGAEHQAIVG